MSVKDKTTSPDLAGHIGEVASKSKGYNTPLLPENQLHEIGNWYKLIAVCRERCSERELLERDEVQP